MLDYDILGSAGLRWGRGWQLGVLILVSGSSVLARSGMAAVTGHMVGHTPGARTHARPRPSRAAFCGTAVTPEWLQLSYSSFFFFLLAFFVLLDKILSGMFSVALKFNLGVLVDAIFGLFVDAKICLDCDGKTIVAVMDLNDDAYSCCRLFNASLVMSGVCLAGANTLVRLMRSGCLCWRRTCWHI